ncbi:MAG: hypothetical protein JWM81_26 [Candidatus Saccharibacteria bacterium]|nr:hypothetical protein [Candidatus Saccharibacteria bacterium]
MPRPYIHAAAAMLAEPNYLRIEEKMLLHGENLLVDDRPVGSSLFATRMAEVTSEPVDAFLFTADSAIPVADAVRGYYEVLDEDLPYLGYVAANRKTSRLSTVPRIRHVVQEAARLRRELKGAKRVVVVDQFKNTGITLNQAQVIARTATSNAEVIPIAGRWYEQTSRNDVMKSGMSSVHSAFMFTIGRLAADQQLTGAAIEIPTTIDQ